MSEYCYQCESCGEFCKCKEFIDPLEYWKSLSMEELMMEEESSWV